jgi:hypothetical protein
MFTDRRSSRFIGAHQALLVFTLFLVSLVCGCVHALHPYNEPSKQKLCIQSARPQDYTIRVADQTDYPVPDDGRVIVDIPRLERGCATYLFGAIKIKDSSPYDVPAIQVKKGNRTIGKWSLNDLAKVPLDSNGYHLLKTE